MSGTAGGFTGGVAALGGAPATPGGTSSKGSELATGGSSITTGGVAALGGSSHTGGASTTGGSSKGGTSSSGGLSSTGGSSKGATSPTGGSAATGGSSKGAASSTGGSVTTGGASKGGTSATGGASFTGGASSKGGTASAITPLANFVRTQGPITLSGISNASGVTWKPETNTFFIVSNGTHALYEYSADFKTRLRTVTLDNGGTDTEDVVYLGSNRFGVVDEENQVYVVSILDGNTSADMSAADAEHYVVSAPPATTNRGFEGITIRPGVGAAGQFIVCQEGGVTGTPMRVLTFDRHSSSGTFSYANSTLAVQEPWNALSKLGTVATDLAAVCFDTASSTLLVLSQESSRLLRVVPESGAILDQRDLSGSPQYEGVTLADGGRLVLVSEPNYVEVYQAN